MHKSNVLRLLTLLLFCLLPSSSCSLKLYELPLDREYSVKISKQLDSEGLKVLKELESRPAPEIGESPKEEKRRVRRDLQEFINKEWEEGWEYIKNKADINTFASDEKGLDGLLVSADELIDFDSERPVVPSRDIRLSFIHLSDVQLHDERVYMFSKELTSFF